MIIIKASMPDPYVIPADPKNGRPKDQRVDRIGSAMVVKVDELIEELQLHGDKTRGSLAVEIARGDFG